MLMGVTSIRISQRTPGLTGSASVSVPKSESWNGILESAGGEWDLLNGTHTVLNVSTPTTSLRKPLQPCRYLEDNTYCAYYDHPLRGNEDIRCYPGGWDCWEPEGGIFYEGRWLTCEPVYSWESGEKRLIGFTGDAIDYYTRCGVSEYTWQECQLEMLKPYWVDFLKITKSQIVDPTVD